MSTQYQYIRFTKYIECFRNVQYIVFIIILLIFGSGQIFSQSPENYDDLFLDAGESQEKAKSESSMNSDTQKSKESNRSYTLSLHGFAGSEVILTDKKILQRHSESTSGITNDFTRDGIVRSELNGRIDLKAEFSSFKIVSLTDFFLEPHREDLKSSREIPIDPLELYITGGEKLIYKIGHFRSGWGSDDLFRCVNFPDSMDMRDFLITDQSRLYRGSPGVSLKYLLSDSFAEILIQPFHIPDEMAPSGSFFEPRVPASDYYYLDTRTLWTPTLDERTGNGGESGGDTLFQQAINEYIFTNYLPVLVPFAQGKEIPLCSEILKNPDNKKSISQNSLPIPLSCDVNVDMKNAPQKKKTMSNASAGARVGGKAGSADWHLMVFEGPAKSPYSVISFDSVDTSVRELSITNEFKYSTEHKAGADFAWAWSKGTLRGEASWIADRGGSYINQSGKIEERYGAYYSYTIGADISHRSGRGRFLIEWNDGDYTNSYFAESPFSDFITLGSEQEFFNGKIKLKLLIMGRPISSNPGYLVMPAMVWDIGNEFNLEIGYFHIQSERDPLLKMYNDKNITYFRLRRSF